MELFQLRECMRSILDEKRFNHSLGVEEVAYDLALIFGYDTEKASIAGILHDCAKYLTEDELVAVCQNNNLPISEEEYRIRYILHAKVGALYAKTRYGIKDEEILDAIRYHTTGRPGMTVLEKIIFIADFIEPNRKNLKDMDIIRIAAYENMDSAVYLITKNVLEYLNSNNATIDSTSKDTYEYYKSLLC